MWLISEIQTESNCSERNVLALCAVFGTRTSPAWSKHKNLGTCVSNKDGDLLILLLKNKDIRNIIDDLLWDIPANWNLEEIDKRIKKYEDKYGEIK